jgi:CRP/FNR family transcriptional regulator|tara:strand:+ start:449 stop:1156 length:708 start_codon:yes stop_codon:yes gene_type:complete
MFKTISNTNSSVNSCSLCVRQKDCIAFKVKKCASNLKITNSQLVRVNDHIFREGDKLENLYVVKSGSIKTFITNQSGQEQILNFHGPGDILGLDGLPFNQNMSTAISLETSSVCALPIHKLKEVLEQLIPSWLIDFAMNKFKQKNSNIYMLGKKNANTRIASFLLKVSENHKMLGCSDTEFDLSMSRDDIGNYLGLASETVSRTFTSMKNKGCVKLDRRHITIVDTQHLQVLAKN